MCIRDRILAGSKAEQYLNYGHKYLKARQYSKAIKYYSYSLKLKKSAKTYYYIGLAYYYMRNSTQALRYFQYALKINPSFALAKKMVAKLKRSAATGGDKYLLAGHRYLKAKNYDMAIKYYQASINMRPTYKAYQYLGTAYYYKGDLQNAKIAYEKSLELNPANPGVKSILAKINAQLGGAGGPRISQQIGVHPLLLATLFAGAIAVLFIF